MVPKPLAFGFGTPFAEQLDFFRQKLNLPSERWDDIMRAAHDRAFIVAGAGKADLLNDLRGAVDKAISQGTGLEAFRKDFRATVAKHGWSGWTGEGSAAGEAWRTKVIYQTNMATSYAAGRYQQLTDPGYLKLRPFWRYVHNDSVMSPRPQHAAWGRARLTLPHDHPFWKTHFPPNGWGCRCRVVAVEAPAPGDATTPPEGWGAIVPKIGEPAGIDKGFGYAPGASVEHLLRAVTAKQAGADLALSRAYVNSLVESPIFDRFFSGAIEGEFPVATLSPAMQVALNAKSPVVLLSQESLAAHVSAHAEVGIADYRNLQRVLDQGEVYRASDTKQIYVWINEALFRTVLKRTGDSEKNYLVTLYRSTDAKTQKEVRDRFEKIR